MKQWSETDSGGCRRGLYALTAMREFHEELLFVKAHYSAKTRQEVALQSGQ